MTCIVGLVTDESTIVFAADSGGYDETTKEVRTEAKVFEKNGCLIGFCGSFRQGQLLEFGFDFSELRHSQNPMEYIVITLIKNLQRFLKKNGCIIKTDGTYTMEIEILIGLRGHIYKIQTDFQVSRANYFCSIGSGSPFALGALEILYSNNFGGIEAAEMALESASKHSLYVTKPFTIIWKYKS